VFSFPARLGSWPLLLSYCLGLLWVASGHALPKALLVIALLGALASPFHRRQAFKIPLLVLLLLFAMAAWNAHHRLRPLPLPPSSALQTLVGEVERIEPQPQRWRMDVRLHQPAELAGQLIRLHVMEQACTLHPGDLIELRTRLRAPRRFGIPGEFDYPRYLAEHDISLSGYVTAKQPIRRLAADAATSPLTRIERWRHQLGQAIAATLPETDSALLLSLVLGEKTRLSQDQRQQLAQLGLSHLFAISGLHLGLLAGGLYFVLQALYRRSDWALHHWPLQQAVALLCLPPLLFYLLFSGGALPTWRAALLATLAVWFTLRQRHVRPIDLLCSIGLLILLVNPLALFGASFQLSFAGVAALILVMPYWQKRCRHWPAAKRWLLLPALVTLSATLGTVPIALWHFHLLPPAAVLNNLFAVPLIGLGALPLALTATGLFALHLPLAAPCFAIAARLLQLCLTMADAISQGFLAARWLYLPPIDHLLIGAICLTLLLSLGGKRKATAGMALLTVVATVTYLAWPTVTPPLQLTTFSVGQGDALLLQRGRDHTMLIDGGGLYSRTFDVGERLLAPALGRLGIRRLETVVLTHDHPDHRKGLLHVLRCFPVGEFWCSTPVNQLHPDLQHVLRQRQIAVRVFPPGWSLVAHDPLGRCEVFVPAQAADKNDQSLVVYASCRNDGLLLCGDLEQAGLRQLQQAGIPGPAQVIKLPHHGSRHAHPQSLLDQLAPHWAIATVGYRNRYHFPHQAVVDHLDQRQITLLRTDRDGTVQLTSSGHGWHASFLASPLPWP
jgi:competence protein ComEC